MQIRATLFIIFFTLSYFNDCLAEDKFMHITVKDGLSQSSVKTILQDFNGYIWFGTADGLNRYNGFSITKFYHEPTKANSLCSNDITCIYENPYDSTLYFGSNESGISIYNRHNDSFNSFKNILKTADRQHIKNIKSIYATDKDSLWILSHGNGLFCFNYNDSSLFSPSFNTNPLFQKTNCIIPDSEGIFWIGTDNGLYFWEPKSITTPQKVNLNLGDEEFSITKLKYDIKGNLYIGTKFNGLLKYNPYSKHTSTIYKPDNNTTGVSKSITDIIITNNNTLWIATKIGLLKIENSEISIYKHNPLNSETINRNNILCLYEDKSGIVWIGTLLGGANRFDPKTNTFPLYKDFAPQSIGSKTSYHNYNTLYAIYIDNKKSVWVNTSNGLLELKPSYFTSRKEKDNVIKHYNKPLIGNMFYNDKIGLLLSFGEGICLRQNNGTLIKLHSDILEQTGNSILSFVYAFTDSDGIIWFSTSKGLLKFNWLKHTFKFIELNADNNNKTPIIISTIIENYEGKLIVGTNDGKLFEFDRHIESLKQIIPINSDKSPRFSRIFAIHESSADQLWIATNTGLYYLNNKSKELKQLIKQSGESITVVYSILVDERDNLWCTSNNGLLKYNSNNGTFQRYTYYEGLQSNEFNQNSFYQSNDGTFYIGGINGLNIFHPKDIQPDNLIPPLIIDKLEILYEPVTAASHPNILKGKLCETKSITLSYKQATFSFEYIALSYRQPTIINYRYMLEGYDNMWIEAGNRRIATYTKVPPGEYTFKVINTNNNGIWNKKPISIKIIILPPYWQTSWFKALLLIILLASFYIILYLKLKGIKNQKAVLTTAVEEKTKTLNEQKIKIEQQNHELISTNEIITLKNKDLNKQHNQIKAQHKELFLLTGKLKETNKAKLRFFTSISHEFRSPLTLIISPLQDIIKNTDKFNKVQLIRHLKTIYSNASKLLLLIDQLLDFRKAETGNDKLTISKIEINSFAKQIISLFDDLTTKNNIKVSFISSVQKLEITGDSMKIEKIITNLLSNAFKNTPNNGEISINTTTITKEKNNKDIQFSVTDTGEGIDENSIPHIFDRFHQGVEDYSKHGSGIGLALVKKYVELHDGEITVNSHSGEGTTFTFTLPAKKHIPNTTIEQTYKPTENNSQQLRASFQSYFPINLNSIETSEDLKKQEILIVEDDNDFNKYLKDALSNYHKITTSSSAEKGFLIASSKNPDLIITDVMLKGMNGFDFCNKIKSHFNTRHIPILLLTALTDHENIVKGLSSGAIDYITKPFEIEYLIIKINNILHLKHDLQTKIMQDSQVTTNEIINEKDKAFIDKIVECIEANISDSSYNVDLLCECVGISHPQVYRRIKSLTNQSVSVFIRNVRLKRAAKLLLSGEMKVNEVAYKVGFSDPNYFTKCFTNLYEQTPREFIKNA